MTDLAALLVITKLLAMDFEAADQVLCDMHTEHLHTIAGQLGMALPTFGGDKPAMIGTRLERIRLARA